MRFRIRWSWQTTWPRCKIMSVVQSVERGRIMPRLFLSLVVVLLSCLAIPSILNADDAEDYLKSGNAWSEKGEYDKAIDAYNQALRLLDPRDTAHIVAVEYNRGNAYGKQSEFDKAIADYNQALAINPKFSHAYNNRGCVWRKKGEYGKAIADHNQCLTVDPKHASAYADLAFLLATCPDEKYRDGKRQSRTHKRLVNWTVERGGRALTASRRRMRKAATSRRPRNGRRRPSNWRQQRRTSKDCVAASNSTNRESLITKS